MRIQNPLFALVIVASAAGLAGCSMDARRKEYAASLESRVPEGCTVKPSMAALSFDCKASPDPSAASTQVQKLVTDECGKLGDLKIGSVSLSAGKAGYFEGYETAKGNCELKKK